MSTFRVRWWASGSARRGRAGAVWGRGGARPNGGGGGGSAGAGELGGCRSRPAPAEGLGRRVEAGGARDRLCFAMVGVPGAAAFQRKWGGKAGGWLRGVC